MTGILWVEEEEGLDGDEEDIRIQVDVDERIAYRHVMKLFRPESALSRRGT